MARWLVINEHAVDLEEAQYFRYKDELPEGDYRYDFERWARIVFTMKNGHTYEIPCTDAGLLWEAYLKILTDVIGISIEEIKEAQA